MKKVAVCGAAVPSTLKMVAGAAANCWIWFRNEPAMNDAKNTVSTWREAEVHGQQRRSSHSACC